MKINSDFINDVKSKLDIVDVIGAYINLQKAGINHKGICPFHQDNHPSMMVSKTRQTYHCFVLCAASTEMFWTSFRSTTR